MRRVVLGIDMGEAEIRFGLVDEDCMLTSYQAVSSTLLAEAGKEAPHRLGEMIDGYMKKTDIVPAAISIGFPSTLDRSRRRLQSTPNLPGFSNVDIVSLLERGLHICPVYIDRDSVMTYYYDRFNYRLPMDSIIIGCYVGTGLGNVISIRGRVLYGHNGCAAELGHIPVLGAKHRCVCGNEGCIEMLASGRVVQELAEKLCGPGNASRVFQDHADHRDIAAFIDAVAVAIATEINILDPEFIIMGGRVVQTPGFPRGLLEKQLVKYARKPMPALNLKVLYSEINQENGVKGAGLYGFEKLKEDGRL